MNIDKTRNFRRDEIPALFNETFNTGKWNSGIVPINDSTLVLFVTMGGKHYYDNAPLLDDNEIIRWFSQNSTQPTSKRGLQLQDDKVAKHVFIRESKRAPFRYFGNYRLASFTGAAPMECKLKRVS